MRPTINGQALEPEMSRSRLISVRPHGGLPQAASHMKNQAVITDLSSRKSSMPWVPHSRPLPDCL